MPTRIMSRRQLADFLNVRTRTIAKWEAMGMPMLLGGNRLRRYNPDAVLKWMGARARKRLAA